MALMPSIKLTENDNRILLDIARQSIDYVLKNKRPLPVNISDYSLILRPLIIPFNFF